MTKSWLVLFLGDVKRWHSVLHVTNSRYGTGRGAMRRIAKQVSADKPADINQPAPFCDKCPEK